MASTSVDLLAPVHRLTVDRYMRMAEAGLFDGAGRIELMDVDVAGAAVEVHREPAGATWGERTTHGAGDVLEPRELPGVTVDVAALLAFVSV